MVSSSGAQRVQDPEQQHSEQLADYRQIPGWSITVNKLNL